MAHISSDLKTQYSLPVTALFFFSPVEINIILLQKIDELDHVLPAVKNVVVSF